MTPRSNVTIVEIPTLNVQRMEVVLIGDSELICSRWSEKAKAQMLAKQMKKAQPILGSVAVIMEDSATGEERTVRAFVNFRDDSGTPDTSLYAAMSDKEIRAQILVRAKAEFDSWHKRYQDLEELALVFAAMDKVAA